MAKLVLRVALGASLLALVAVMGLCVHSYLKPVPVVETIVFYEVR